ncbi:branched-chain amino acid ABC transporter permease [Falsochrobactrum shanghaiense]|uniref:Branched-chain amino acid ABC transporter permease n=1 Tax=Falsochrobactrum shanghaiense TaxID=2201899 RepID=A0A316JBC2_9HYPH|nr:branched-chain amino acid ABC transporter permease [Falsochrobactrum shanghaiense]PWL16303.1 branched-chain amino acid ABC transporter permease [Falsochrobactrum shanghaiense]
MKSKNCIELGAIAVAGTAVILTLPIVTEIYTIYSVSVYLIMAMLALSLGFVWGIGGILSFGQAAFFGIGGYTYALYAINEGSSTMPLLMAVAVPAIVAALVGYFTFYGRVSDVYFGVISLILALILYNVVNSSSGAEFTIGSAPIGGYNGIPTVPSINVPFAPDQQLDYGQFFYVAAFSLLIVYLLLRVLMLAKFGRVVAAVRENELRAELLGYDVRLYRLGTFCIGAGIAGFAGALFAAWGNFIGPSVFSLGFSAQVIVWVVMGGLGTLVGPMIGAALIQAVITWLGDTKILEPMIVLGSIFLALVLVVPKGLVPSATSAWRRIARRGEEKA